MLTTVAACVAGAIVASAVISHIWQFVAVNQDCGPASLARTSAIASHMVLRRHSRGLVGKRLRLSIGAAVAIVAGPVGASPAQADEISMQQLSLLQQFNLIDLGSFSTSSEIEGRGFVAGDESGQLSNIGFNNGLTPSSAGYATLTVDGSVNGNINVQTGNVAVGGNLNGANLNSNNGATSQVGGNLGNVNVNGGTLQYSGVKTGNVNANGGASVQQVANLTPGIASSTFATLSNLASTLDRLSANSSVTLANGTVTFNGKANASGQAIFEVSSSVFAANQFQFNLNGATSAIINVDGGGSIADNANFLGGAAQSLAHDLIWNFNNATTLNVGAEFGGTILAVDAQVTNTAAIDGTLVSDSLTQYGELHSYDYTGTLPDGGANDVPEPPTMTVLAAGLFGLLLVRRGSVRV